MILLESKRDDLLLPYLEILKSKGIEMSLGQFKGVMLNKLSDEGGIRNLSLSSNYSLSGAVRYYFEGMLTNNKDLSIFKGQGARDNWNENVCKMLNACIEVLRNAYIDTIGTQFEQPEDFGKLSLPKLLRKYNKKIMQVLGVDKNEDEEQQKVEYKDSDKIGNKGYTYNIMYSHQDCRQFERPTAPGSWCITYGQGHYDSYVRRLNIHYVIFLKDGYENIKREPGKGFTHEKPHDAYGNSMIALLQSNSNGEPVYITSRWNHGAGGPEGRVEADHAYTKEEFLNVVGITDADLQKIFEIWKHNKKFNSGENCSSVGINRDEKIASLRELKYIQMKINGGEAPEKLVSCKKIFGKEDASLTKCVSFCFKDIGNHRFFFLMDKGKILFDTVINKEKMSMDKSWCAERDGLIALQYDPYGFLYDIRMHSFVSINGITKFKRTLNFGAQYLSNFNVKFTSVKMDSKTIALVSLKTKKPIVLPNGESWVNGIYSSHKLYKGISRDLSCDAFSEDETILHFIYDESSGENYFYDTLKNKFFEVPQNTFGLTRGNANPSSYCSPILGGVSDENLFTICYSQKGEEYNGFWGRTQDIAIDYKTLKPMKLGGIFSFTDLKKIDVNNNKNLYFIEVGGENATYYDNSLKTFLYNIETDEIFKDFDIYMFQRTYENGRFIAFEPRHKTISYGQGDEIYIYDSERNGFLMNTVNQNPTDKTFLTVCERMGFGEIDNLVLFNRGFTSNYLNYSYHYSREENFNFYKEQINRIIEEGRAQTVELAKLPLANKQEQQQA